jgi:peptide deformylase
MVLPITKLPAKVLRAPVKDVSFPLTKDNRRLVTNMLASVKKAQGIGLAAPQVGKSLNLALIYLEEAGLPAFPIFNPKIIKSSKELAPMEEGCLSLPGIFGIVQRPKKITIEAYDEEGKKFTLTDDGLLARVLQHEIDHLNNVLIIDKWEKITFGEELLPKYQ